MLKRIAPLILVVLLLFVVGYKISINIKEQSLVNQQPVDYFPEGVGLFLRLNDLSKTMDHFMETSMIWSSFESQTSRASTKKIITTINALTEDELLNNAFNDGATYVAIYSGDSAINWVIVKNIKNIGEEITDSVLIENSFISSFYCDIQEPFLIISDKKEILSKLSHNIKSNLKELNGISNKMKLSSELSSVSCFIDLKYISPIFNGVLKPSFSKDLPDLLKTKKWIQFDINYSPKEIKVTGITNENLEINLSLPQYFPFSEMIPNDLILLKKEVISLSPEKSDTIDLLIKSMRLKFQDNIAFKSHEMLFLENPLDSGSYSFYISSLFTDSILHEKGSENCRLIDTSFMLNNFPEFDFHNKYGFIGDHRVVVSSREAKKELEFQLMNKNNKKINDAILQHNNRQEFDQAQSLFTYKSKDELANCWGEYSLDSSSTISDFIHLLDGVSWTVNNFNSRAHHSIKVRKGYPKKSDKKILWKTFLPSVCWGPYILKNHRTQTKDIVVMDSSNKLHYLGASGKIKWTKQLAAPIIGGISQIDAYKNNKYQMVFNTEDKLHVIDILGNELEGFPVPFSFKATNEIAILDYDGNKDYRLLIAGSDLKIHNYNCKGSEVKGWLKPVVSSKITKKITHFAINGKDYIFSIESNGKMNFLNRKGGERFIAKQHLSIGESAKYFIDKSFAIDSTKIYYEDSSQSIFSFLMKGKQKELVYSSDSGQFFLNNNFAVDEWSYYCVNQDKLKIIEEGNQEYEFNFPYPFEIIASSNTAGNIGVFNRSVDQIQIVDRKYRLNPTVFKASKNICIVDLNKDSQEELITVVNKSVLVCYQIPLLK